jgi:site-specific DNA recombinase
MQQMLQEAEARTAQLSPRAFETIASLVHKRAAIYIRVSSKKQEDGYSYEFQKEQCLQRCREKGYVIDKERHIFFEIHTGVEYRERDVLSAMRQAVYHHEFDVLIVYKIDRLARNRTHLAIVREDLHYHGVLIESITPDDYSDDESIVGEIIRLVRGYLAEEEHKNIVQRTQDGIKKKLHEGKLLGTGVPLYGYIWNGRGKTATHYLLDPEIVAVGEDGKQWTKGAVVTHINDLYDQGWSLRKIIEYLDQNRIPTPEGKLGWAISTVRARLDNPFYTGKAEAFKWHWKKIDGKLVREVTPDEERIELPEGLIPPLVSLDVFERNQRRLADNQRLASRNNDDVTDSLLRCGLAVCGYCGASLVFSRRPNGHIYKCRRKQFPNGDCRESGAISANFLDDAVWKYAEGIIQDPSRVAAKVQEKRRENTAHNELAPINRRDRRLKEIAEEMQNLITLAQKAPVPSVLETVPGLLKALEEEKANLESQRQQLLHLEELYKKEDEALTQFEQQCAIWRAKVGNPDYQPTYQFKRQVLEFFGVKAHVWRSDGKPNYEITTDPPSIVSIIP